MSATCPQCSASDCTVTVPYALAATTHPPLDEPTRARLAPPPPPAPGPHKSTVATVFYALAGVFITLSVLPLARALREDLADAGAVEVIAVFLGALTLPGSLLTVGLIARAVSRRRHERAFADDYAVMNASWQRHQHVWQASWFCRRCHVAFFPDAVLRPDFLASPPIPLDQFPLWVVTATDRAYGFPPSPAASG
ncbi:hypothetical protein ABTX81_22090 [Kitasatospora sp. NPDC097605]|uniref:hypothetical protein n=1 Tax=Kitasatospora sp. NPDC097605 TaxID=3157226 RepID=UPI00331B53F8